MPFLFETPKNKILVWGPEWRTPYLHSRFTHIDNSETDNTRYIYMYMGTFSHTAVNTFIYNNVTICVYAMASMHIYTTGGRYCKIECSCYENLTMSTFPPHLSTNGYMNCWHWPFNGKNVLFFFISWYYAIILFPGEVRVGGRGEHLDHSSQANQAGSNHFL